MRFIIILFICTIVGALSAQKNGVITYVDKVDIHRRLPEDRQQYKDMIPQFRTTNFELYYTEGESMYVKSEEQEPDDMNNGGRMRFMMGNPTRDVYKNLDENRMVDSREFMTKQFLIKGPLDSFKWKIEDDQMIVGQYLCLKASFADTADSYIAWFTPQIPVSNGPAEYGGLPGMILHLDLNDGERTITATEIKGEDFNTEILQEPKKGKEVTSEEFREIVREKMQEMRGQQQGGGHHIIIRQ